MIENGAGYDDFVDRLLVTQPRPARDVISVGESVGATGGNPNPHLWYARPTSRAAATAIEMQLAKDPA